MVRGAANEPARRVDGHHRRAREAAHQEHRAGERANLENVVPAVAQPLRHAVPGAALDEEPHEPPTAIVAGVSLAITACA